MRKLKTASLLELVSLKGGSLQGSAPYLNPLWQNENVISPNFLRDEGSLLLGGSLCPLKLPGCPSPGVSSPWSLSSSYSCPFCLSCVSKWQFANPLTEGKTPLEPAPETVGESPGPSGRWRLPLSPEWSSSRGAGRGLGGKR